MNDNGKLTSAKQNSVPSADSDCAGYEEVAAVDLGSNSFHMVVAQVRDGQPVVVDRIKQMVRLGAGLDENNMLSHEARDRALDCLALFGERIRHLPACNVRVVGTNTLRLARKSGNFIQLAEQRLGHEVEVIAGVEEARLIYRGVARSLEADDRQRLVVDIGGGSTELIIGSGFKPGLMKSVSLGCISMTNQVFPGGEITAERMNEAVLLVARRVETFIRRYRQTGWDICIGASGTARSAAEVIGIERGHTASVVLEELEWLCGRLVEIGHIDAVDFPGMNAERRPVFVGGTAVLLGVFKALGIERMEVSPGALREGVLDELCGRLAAEDIRDDSVSGLMQRFNVDTEQAQRVADTAAGFLAQVKSPWGLGTAVFSRRLRWAAQLHEIGLDIAHNGYHRHSEYILAKADIAGFSQQEQELVASLLRMHRKRFQPSSHLQLVTPERHLAVEQLAVLLRLAVLLHRNRSDDVVSVQLLPGERSLALQFADGWLSGHPLTQSDLEQEARLLVAAGWQLSFE